GGPSRLPIPAEQYVARQAREYLASRCVSFGYGSLGSGADILIAEALLESGAELHVVLPFDSDEFDRVSVAPAGPSWSERFRTCLARATSVLHASDSVVYDDELFAYAGRIAMGHALNRAKFLDAPAEQLAVWDHLGTDNAAGTARDVAIWRDTGNPGHIIAVAPSATPAGEPTSQAIVKREIGSILFTDFSGFSRLR